MEFLQLIETMEAEKASIGKLFGGEGVGARHSSRRNDPRYMDKLIEATRFVESVYSGRQPIWKFKEALTTGDFPNLFGDIIDRQLLGIYNEYAPVYKQYARVATVSDFRTVKRFAMDGSEAVLTSVGQGEEYPESKLSDTAYSYAVSKFGRKTAIEWESMVNDDLDGLKDLPRRYGRAARRSEQKFATGLYADANGPHASLYTAGNKNIVNATNAGAFSAVNPPLSVAGLQQAFAVLANQLDADGEPINVDAVVLVVPPGLEITALNILNSTELWITGDAAGGTAATQVHVANWLRNRLTSVVDPYLPVVVTNGTRGQTSWFLFASASQAARPAIEVGFLRGHETPEIFMKESNAIRVGGGASDPMDGDFEVDAIVYKIRHVFGGTRLDPKVTVASNGTGA